MATVNFVSDFGAPTNGVTNASPAVDSWLTYAIANDGSTLIIPAHAYHLAGTNAFSNGVRNCTIQAAAGASVDALFIGHSGLIREDFTHSARIATVQAGATSVTLITGSQISRFSVDQWIMVAGLGLQTSGYPPNFQYNEFRKITAINGSTISFTDELTYAYLSTWPLVDPAVVQTYDLGGPAIIYAMTAEFDGDQTYSGLTVTASGAIFMGVGRSMILDGMAFTGLGPAPSVGKSLLINNTDFGQQNEIDKCVELIEYRDCFSTVGAKQILLQSACPNTLILTRTPVTTLNGTAATTVIDGGSIGVLVGGTLGYGRSRRILKQNSPTIGAIDPSSGSRTAAHFIDPADLSFTAGIFKVGHGGNIDGVVGLFVPGYRYVYGYYAGTVVIQPDSGSIVHFGVYDMTQDGSYTYVHTDLTAVPVRTYSGGNQPNAIFAYACKTTNDGPLSVATAFLEPGYARLR